VLIVMDKVPKGGLERAKPVDRISRVAEEMGVPWWYPIEVHLATREELEMSRKGGARVLHVSSSGVA
jgi:hypothetical protein